MLSPDLKESFQILNSIHREQRHLEGNEKLAKQCPTARIRETSTTAQEDSVSGMGYVSSSTKEELQARKFEVALTATLAAEAEISVLEKGIEELEAMILQQGNDECNGQKNVFPTFPHIVVDCSEIIGKDISSTALDPK